VATLQTFVETQLVPVLKPGDIVIWDNLKAHFSAAVVQAIEATGARVEYLPPYSPDLNPIELLWSKAKDFLKGAAASTQEALLDAIRNAVDQVSASNVKAWYHHCGYVKSFC
jgi:transposase